MTIRRSAALLVLSLATLAPVAHAQTIDQRVDSAQRRIEQGMRSGSLTRDEARALREELLAVRRDERRAKADGRLDRRERERLDHELNRLERHISALKHNDVQRGSARREGYRP